MATPAAVEANLRGNDAKDAGDLPAAEAAYQEAIALAPDFEAPWFNLGVIYKWQRRWAEARHAVERSLALVPDDNQGALWNLGIVATAQGDWPTARAAWTRYGIAIPSGEGPPEMELGITPVRLANGEVVWCHRIDPARAVVASIPLPESGRRHGDLLLHDGAPHGSRKVNDHTYSVFDELALLAASNESTFRAEVVAPSPEDIAELQNDAEKLGIGFEDWTSSIEVICRACSEGTPHEHGPGATATTWSQSRKCAFAASAEESVRKVLESWASGRASHDAPFDKVHRRIDGIERLL
jgi:hypothetical protein